MTRLIKAIENPYTTILGHMTGRLLLSRNGYPVDHKKIIDACAANHVVIEINAHPRRLDIDWRWIDYAIEKNVLFSIDPDAHSLDGFDDMKYGVLAAQKGGLTKEKNLSSFSLKQFEDCLAKTRKQKGYLIYQRQFNMKSCSVSFFCFKPYFSFACSTIPLHMARPRPVPDDLVVKLGINIRDLHFFGIPSPLSFILILIFPSINSSLTSILHMPAFTGFHCIGKKIGEQDGSSVFYQHLPSTCSCTGLQVNSIFSSDRYSSFRELSHFMQIKFLHIGIADIGKL